MVAICSVFIFFRASRQRKYTCPIFSVKRILKKVVNSSCKMLERSLKSYFCYRLTNLVNRSTPVNRNHEHYYVLFNLKLQVCNRVHWITISLVMKTNHSFKQSPVLPNILTLRK